VASGIRTGNCNPPACLDTGYSRASCTMRQRVAASKRAIGNGRRCGAFWICVAYPNGTPRTVPVLPRAGVVFVLGNRRANRQVWRRSRCKLRPIRDCSQANRRRLTNFASNRANATERAVGARMPRSPCRHEQFVIFCSASVHIDRCIIRILDKSSWDLRASIAS
jgi:hypothetical protein